DDGVAKDHHLSGERCDEDNGQNSDDHREAIVDSKMAHGGAFVTDAIGHSISSPVKALLTIDFGCAGGFTLACVVAYGALGQRPVESRRREDQDALAALRSDCGGWPKARMKARPIRSGSRNPVTSATRSIASLEDCTRCRATSIRNRSTAFDGVVPVSAMKARVKCRELMPACSAMSSTVSGASRCSRAQASSGANRPVGAFNSSSEENCDWPPLRRWYSTSCFAVRCTISSP